MVKYILLSAILSIIFVIITYGHSKQVVKDILDSLKSNSDGYSNTKLVGWAGLLIVGYITGRFTTESNINEILIAWLSFIAISLGLVKVGDLIMLRTGQKTTETTTKSETKTITEQKPKESLDKPKDSELL